jgi:hypothetical protein
MCSKEIRFKFIPTNTGFPAQSSICAERMITSVAVTIIPLLNLLLYSASPIKSFYPKHLKNSMPNIGYTDAEEE